MTNDPSTQTLSIEEEMKGSYLTYAMSVIIQRALPDVRDGLKPSQRRILVAMHDLNLGPRSKHRKCAKIAGDTSGNYHPHGESVIYPTLVRMAQPFNMRQPLVDGQGNFGSIDGDPPAAMRYTEARMTSATLEMLDDIDKNTVDFIPNYDETRSEPTVLPSRFPNLLVNGGQGIAVGMATNFAPHNAREICQGILTVLDNPEVTIPELMEVIPGPDFPTGGLICGRAGIKRAYALGRGVLTLRAKVHTEEEKNHQRLIVTEIPYQVSKSKLASDIADGVKEGRLSGISDVRDESDRTGIRLVIELKRGENDQVVLNQLFKHTGLQSSFGIQAIALVKGRPRTLNLKQLLLAYRDHRREVIRRRALYLLEKAEHKAHILRGLLIALDNIDRVIELIRSSRTVDDARTSLRAEFSLTRIQADAILQMRLQRLTGLEREKIEEDLEKTMAEIAELREILTSEARVIQIIREDVEALIAKYPDPRRSEITDIENEIDVEDLIAEEQMVVTQTQMGYVKRTPLAAYRAQGRGGKGITGGSAREGDFIKSLFVANTLDFVLYFTDRGKVYWLKVYQIPEGSRTSRGRAIVNLLPLEKDERVLSAIQVREFDDRMVMFATRKGYVKKTALNAFSRPKKTGIIAINIFDDDQLVGATLTGAGDDVVLSSANGMAIRFNEEDAREMGRVSRGVKGINLTDGDKVVSMAVVVAEDEGGALLTLCKNGYGKRTLFTEYRRQFRGGKGLKDIQANDRNGPVMTALSVTDNDDLMIMTAGGKLVRISASDIRPIGRNTQGMRLIRLNEGDVVSGAEKVESEDDEDPAGAEGADGAADAAVSDDQEAPPSADESASE
ncbi:MAG: DNA gyrase subunit A [Planctomycetota bacterium]